MEAIILLVILQTLSHSRNSSSWDDVKSTLVGEGSPSIPKSWRDYKNPGADGNYLPPGFLLPDKKQVVDQ